MMKIKISVSNDWIVIETMVKRSINISRNNCIEKLIYQVISSNFKWTNSSGFRK